THAELHRHDHLHGGVARELHRDDRLDRESRRAHQAGGGCAGRCSQQQHAVPRETDLHPLRRAMSAARMYRTTRHSQRGRTLLEVMIAMTIALFLLGGVITMLGGTRAAAGTQRQLAQLQDNERLAMTLLTDVIQAAGYFPNPVANTAAGTLPADATFASPGQGLAGTSVAAGPDTISVRYATQQDDGAINCV